jgi:hypothetical protein
MSKTVAILDIQTTSVFVVKILKYARITSRKFEEA